VSDHASALARTEAAEREAARLTEANAALEHDLAAARTWLGGARKRAAVFAAIVTGAIALGAAGFAIGRATADASPPPPEMPAKPIGFPPAPIEPPRVAGAMMVDGPDLGSWVAKPTQCIVQPDRSIQLDADDNHTVWLSHAAVQLETPDRVQVLDEHKCYRMLHHDVLRDDDNTFSGFLDVDCEWLGNHVIGRIDVAHCRSAP
jgi:hypothetical protein